MSTIARLCAAAFALSVLPASAQTIEDQFNLDFDSFTDQSAYAKKARKSQEKLNSLLTQEEITNGYSVTLIQERSDDQEANPKQTNQKQTTAQKTNLRHLAARKGYYSICSVDKETGAEQEYAVAISFAYDVGLAKAQGMSPQARFGVIAPLEEETYRFLNRLSRQKTSYTPAHVTQISKMFYDNLSAFNNENSPGLYRAFRAESGVITRPGCQQSALDEASFEKMRIQFIDSTASGIPNEPEIKAGMDILKVNGFTIAQKGTFIRACSDDKTQQVVVPLVIAYNMTGAYESYMTASARAEIYKLVQDNARDYLDTLAYAPDAYTADYALNVRVNFIDHIRTSIEFAQKNAGLSMGADVPNIVITAKGCDDEKDWTWDKYNLARKDFVAAGSKEAQQRLTPPAPPAAVKEPENPRASKLTPTPI